MRLIHGTIEDCTNNGSFLRTASDSYGSNKFQSYGGIVGANTGKILRCNNYGSIKANYKVGYVYKFEYFGGICGSSCGSIINCANSGDIFGVRVGGICGGTYYKTTSAVPENAEADLYILNCKNTGELDRASSQGGNYTRVGAFIASVAVGNVYIKNSYALEGANRGMAKYDSSLSGYIDVKGAINVENCYGINAGIYNSDYSSDALFNSVGITFSNVYTTINTVYTVDGVSYNNSETYMKTQEFCDKLNNNQVSETGEPIFKFIDSQDYPALYWE